VADIEQNIAENMNRIKIVGTQHFLRVEELAGAVVVQPMGSNVIVRLTNGECVVVRITDLDR
jgi:hypothetical protein